MKNMKKNNIIKPVFISSFIENSLLQVKGIETHPAQRHSKMSNLKVESGNSLPQRHSKMSNLVEDTMGVMRVIGVIGRMGKIHITKNSSAQRHSKMSKLGRCPINQLCPPNILNLENASPQRHSKMSNLKVESGNSSAQRHSGISNLSMGLMGPIGLMGRKPVMKNTPTQQDSGISNLGVLGILGWKTKNESSSVQRHSKMSNLKVKSENSSAQRDFGISKLGMGLMGVMGLTGRKHKSKNCPTQQDSGISNLKTSPYRPLVVRLVPLCGDPYRPLDFKTTPAQPDSKIYKLKFIMPFFSRYSWIVNPALNHNQSTINI